MIMLRGDNVLLSGKVVASIVKDQEGFYLQFKSGRDLWRSCPFDSSETIAAAVIDEAHRADIVIAAFTGALPVLKEPKPIAQASVVVIDNVLATRTKSRLYAVAG